MRRSVRGLSLSVCRVCVSQTVFLMHVNHFLYERVSAIYTDGRDVWKKLNDTKPSVYRGCAWKTLIKITLGALVTRRCIPCMRT